MKYAAQNATKKHKRKMKCMRKDLTASLESQSVITCQIAKQTRKISGKQNFDRVKDDERSRACFEEHSETAGLFLLALLFVL